MNVAHLLKSAEERWAGGDVAGAVRIASEVLQTLPLQPRANELVGAAHAQRGEWEPAVRCMERAVQGEPSNPRLHFGLGTVRGNTGDVRGAADSFQRALDVSPGFVQAMVPLAIALVELGDSADAESVLRRALSKHPTWPDAIGAMAAVLTDRARTVEAGQLLRQGIAANPGNPALLRMLCQTLNYIEGADPGEARTLRENHGRLLPQPQQMSRGMVPNTPDPERRLRVGYLSPDLRRHPVAHFAEPFLTRHDPVSIETFVYFSGAREDDVTARIKGAVPHWRQVRGLPDPAVLDQIRADQIDILVELSGLTGGDRLTAIAARAAPIQATYIGCPSSTGVPAIDLRFVDAITDPPGAEAHASERLIRLDGCFLCYRPPDDAPEAAPPPSANPAAPITFGSFNNLAKLSPGTIALWTRIIAATPTSRLLLKGKALGDATAAREVGGRFTSAGMESDRLELVGDIPDFRGHLAAYSRIDIALDPFPYNGTTTTCEALWMGVPVVTLRGQLHAGRVGASLLTAAGHPEWIGETADEVVRIASGLAADRNRLAQIRAGLRAQVAASRLCDSAAHTRALEGAYRDAWRAWCTA